MSDPVQAAFADLQTAIVKERTCRKASDTASAFANDAMKALGEATQYVARCRNRLLELAEKPTPAVVPTGVEHVRSLAAEPTPEVKTAPRLDAPHSVPPKAKAKG